MNDDIVWLRFTYPDSSQIIFRGTRNIDIISQCVHPVPNLDVYGSNGLLLDGFVFNITSRKVIEIESDVKIEEFKTKPKYERRIDKFASCFI